MEEKQMRGRTEEERLVGALGGAGGTLVLGPLLSYFIVPETRNLRLLLIFETIGIFLIAMAAVVHLRKRKRKDR
ncbi:MAG: hypothetical protein QW128_07070 [Thermoprotei archaeon]